MKLRKFKAMLGPPEEWPEGSPEWCERIANRLQLRAQSLSKSTVRHLKEIIETIIEADPHPWEVWPKPPYGTPDDYCLHVTGFDWDALLMSIKGFDPDDTGFQRKARRLLAEAQAKNRGQGTRTDLLRYHVPKLTGGNSSAKLLRRLAHNHPDILDRYEAGEFKSVRAAAKAAGILNDKPPYDQIIRLLPKLTPAERRKLRRQL
jgi:hypothetical protein